MRRLRILWNICILHLEIFFRLNPGVIHCLHYALSDHINGITVWHGLSAGSHQVSVIFDLLLAMQCHFGSRPRGP